MYLEILLMIMTKNDTSLFVQKPYLRSNYLDSIIQEDIDLKKFNLELKIYLILSGYETLVVKIMLIIYSTILVY